MPSLPALIFGSHSPLSGLQTHLQLPCQYPGLVSWGCWDKLPQTWWVKTTHTHSRTVPEVSSPKSISLGRRCRQSWFLLETLREETVSLPFSTPGSYLYFLACGLFLHLQCTSLQFSSLSSNNTPLPLTCKDPCNYIQDPTSVLSPCRDG